MKNIRIDIGRETCVVCVVDDFDKTPVEIKYKNTKKYQKICNVYKRNTKHVEHTLQWIRILLSGQ